MQTNSLGQKLILGTVQFGLNYGINNQFGKLQSNNVDKILQLAYANNIYTLDTADAYGNATDLIGDFHKKVNYHFNIITKFKDGSQELALNTWIKSTLDRLNIDTLEACMFHSIQDYENKPYLVKQLFVLHQQGFIKHIGVSIYTNEQFEKVIADPLIDLVQLPYNLLDNFSIRGNLIKKAKALGKIIHVRSVFLQGLFFMNLDKLPSKLLPLKSNLNFLQQLCKKYDIPMQSLALNYVHRNLDIDGIIIGIDSLEQLQANIDALKMAIPIELFSVINNITTQQPELLNPFNWS